MSVVRKIKPTSPGSRHKVVVSNPDLYKGRPVKSLLKKKKRCSGRSHGTISVRHRGGGHKRHIRIIDFKRADKDGILAVVERIEYDPNRTADLALLKYVDGERRYMILPKGLAMGDEVHSGKDAPIKPGSCMLLADMPVGSVVHCVELRPGKGAQMARSAGSSAQIVAREGKYVVLRLRSTETRKVLSVCRAVLGEVGNAEHNLRSLGKAGATRWRGRRPTVRGVAMNPVDHPHGGGEGKTSGGRHPVSPTGVPAKGYKTVRKVNPLIVRRRRKKKR